MKTLLAVAALVVWGSVSGVAQGVKVETAVATPYQMNGIAVGADGRIFVGMPRWMQKNSFSVGVVKNGIVVPYPGNGWNAATGDLKTRFSSVNALRIEPHNPKTLWAVDCGQGGVGETKLVKISLESNSVERVYRLTAEQAPAGSCLNDVRVVENHAFLTESGTGALIVIDLQTGNARRLLSASGKTKMPAGPPLVADGRPLVDAAGKRVVVNADDIEISPDKQWLYFGVPFGGTLWQVKIADLLNTSLSDQSLDAKVQAAGEFRPAGGILMLADGTLLLGDTVHNSLDRWWIGKKIETLVTSPELQWPDAMAVGPDGNVYEALPQANKTPIMNHGADQTQKPFRIVKYIFPTNDAPALKPLEP